MTDYNKYVEAVNKIFELVAKMKAYYPDQDNLSLIEAIEEHKQIVITSAKLFSNDAPKTTSAPTTSATPIQQVQTQQVQSAPVTETLEA